MISAFVVGHNVFAVWRNREMLSEAFDRYMGGRWLRWLMYAIVGSVALHLVNLMPVKLDWIAGGMGVIVRLVKPVL